MHVCVSAGGQARDILCVCLMTATATMAICPHVTPLLYTPPLP